MKTKNRLLATFVTISAVLLIAVISLIVVVASLQAKAESGFKISYSAYNVQAEISAEYKLETASTWEDVGKVTFDGTGTDETGENATLATKTLDPVNDVKLDKTNTYVIIHHTIKNNGSTACSIDINESSITSNNMKIGYATTENPITWGNDFGTVVGTTIASGATVNVYTKVSIDDVSQVANFDGTFVFLLVASDPV